MARELVCQHVAAEPLGLLDPIQFHLQLDGRLISRWLDRLETPAKRIILGRR